MACIGGGSNAIGMFYPFVNDKSVAMYGAEASGLGLDTEKHAATFAKGRPGILHGALMDVLQDAHGQIMEAFSISAGHVWKELSLPLSLAMPLPLRKKWQLRCRQTKASSSASQVVGTRTLCRLKNVSKLKQKGNKP